MGSTGPLSYLWEYFRHHHFRALKSIFIWPEELFFTHLVAWTDDYFQLICVRSKIPCFLLKTQHPKNFHYHNVLSTFYLAIFSRCHKNHCSMSSPLQSLPWIQISLHNDLDTENIPYSQHNLLISLRILLLTEIIYDSMIFVLQNMLAQ